MASSPPPSSAAQPGPLHRLLLRVQCVELGGGGGSEQRAGYDDDEAQPRPSPPSSPPSAQQYRRRAVSKDMRVRDVVALVDTTAHSIFKGLVEAEMPAATEDVLARYALVMVYPTREADGSLTHLLHTLTRKERPALVEKVLEEAEAAAAAPGATPGSDEGVSSEGFSRQQLLEENLLSWFLKDLGGAPLDFRGYVSGAETSEDEAAAPWYSDMNQLGVGQGYYSGYLLKQSSQDPCLWRRRWCILGEDKIWYMKLKHRRSHQGRAAFFPWSPTRSWTTRATPRCSLGLRCTRPTGCFCFGPRTARSSWTGFTPSRSALPCPPRMT